MKPQFVPQWGQKERSERELKSSPSSSGAMGNPQRAIADCDAGAEQRN